LEVDWIHQFQGPRASQDVLERRRREKKKRAEKKREEERKENPCFLYRKLNLGLSFP
jgi:hypothetical protein